MAVFNKFDAFVEDVCEAKHNFAADTITCALTNTAPIAANAILSAITQIAYTNLPTSRVVTISTSSQTTGTYTAVAVDKVLTATGGAVATFRYVVLYNDTTVAPVDPLICWYDYGVGGVTLADGETFTIDFGASLFSLV